MQKVAIIGAGNVGATSAVRIAEKGLADVVMIDTKEGMAKAKALDISDAAFITGHESKVCGTEDFKGIKGSRIVIVTAGFPRKPGMKREELLSKNKEIMETVCLNIKKYASDSIVIVVTNPLDIMSYAALKETGFPKKRVFGMAGDLDASRFTGVIAQKLGVESSSIKTIVMGSHGDTMVPVVSQTKVSGKPIGRLLSKKDVDELVKQTKQRGAEIVSLLKQGSAYYAPSAAIWGLVESILTDKKRMHCVSAFLEGEYGFNDICIGVPAIIGNSGIEKVLEIELSTEEKDAFRCSAEAVKENLVLCQNMISQ